MPKNKTVIGKGWMRKSDWNRYASFFTDSAPLIFRCKGKKEDWDDEDWPPVKVEFEFEIKQAKTK